MNVPQILPAIAIEGLYRGAPSRRLVHRGVAEAPPARSRSGEPAE